MAILILIQVELICVIRVWLLCHLYHMCLFYRPCTAQARGSNIPKPRQPNLGQWSPLSLTVLPKKEEVELNLPWILVPCQYLLPFASNSDGKLKSYLAGLMRYGNPDTLYLGNILCPDAISCYFRGARLPLTHKIGRMLGHHILANFYGFITIWHPWNDDQDKIHDQKAHIFSKSAIYFSRFPEMVDLGRNSIALPKILPRILPRFETCLNIWFPYWKSFWDGNSAEQSNCPLTILPRFYT